MLMALAWAALLMPLVGWLAALEELDRRVPERGLMLGSQAFWCSEQFNHFGEVHG
jgi:hypothetical protein